MPEGHSLQPGDPVRLGAYRVVGRLGEGNQGVVFLGRDASDTPVAIKLLHARMADRPRARERFVRELSAAKKVARFCTAQVLDADLAGDQPYIVSEYVDGRSLRAHILDEGPRSGGALERLAISTLTALAAIHTAGIVHRDFNPRNVLLGPDGPRVIDFGIARALGAARHNESNSVGTPAYMAPEQVSGEEIGPPTDLFAWGATIVFAATGRPPFGNESVAAVMERVLRAEADVTPLPEPLRSVVSGCLSKDPAARPTAQQAHAALLGQEPVGPLSPPPAFGARGDVPAGPADPGETHTPTAAARLPSAGPSAFDAPAAPAGPGGSRSPLCRMTTGGKGGVARPGAATGAPHAGTPAGAARPGATAGATDPGAGGGASGRGGTTGAAGHPVAGRAAHPAGGPAARTRGSVRTARMAVAAGAAATVLVTSLAVALWSDGGDAATSPKTSSAAAPPSSADPSMPPDDGPLNGSISRALRKPTKRPAPGCRDHTRTYGVPNAGSVRLKATVCRDVYSGTAVLIDTAPADGWEVCVQLRGHVTGTAGVFISTTIMSSKDGRGQDFKSGPAVRFGPKTRKSQNWVQVNAGRCRRSDGILRSDWQTHQRLATG